jgi:glycosyltransferase involved in cell wall biosynthesis
MAGGVTGMHVLVVNVFFAPFTYGGATIVAEGLARELVARGHRVTAISAVSRPELAPYAAMRCEVDGIVHHLVNLPPGRGYAQLYANPEVAERVARIAAEAAPDIAHLHCLQEIGADSIPALRRLGIPVVLSVHDFWWLCERQFMLRRDGSYCAQDPVRLEACRGCAEDIGRAAVRRDFLAAAAAGADLVTYPSRFARDLCEASGLAPGRGIVLENGVRLPGPQFLARQAARRAADPRLVFGYVGGPSPIKGWPLVRSAFRTIGRDDFRGILLDGALDGRWYGPGATDGLRGDWEVAGRVSQDELDSFYERIDVLLFPSQWKETFGLAVREALARGIRVIQTRGGGTSEHGCAAMTRCLGIGDGAEALRDAVEAECEAGPYRGPLPAIASFADQATALLHAIAPLAEPGRASRVA